MNWYDIGMMLLIDEDLTALALVIHHLE